MNYTLTSFPRAFPRRLRRYIYHSGYVIVEEVLPEATFSLANQILVSLVSRRANSLPDLHP